VDEDGGPGSTRTFDLDLGQANAIQEERAINALFDQRRAMPWAVRVRKALRRNE
jgi:hypothetical protein